MYEGRCYRVIDKNFFELFRGTAVTPVKIPLQRAPVNSSTIGRYTP